MKNKFTLSEFFYLHLIVILAILLIADIARMYSTEHFRLETFSSMLIFTFVLVGLTLLYFSLQKIIMPFFEILLYKIPYLRKKKEARLNKKNDKIDSSTETLPSSEKNSDLSSQISNAKSNNQKSTYIDAVQIALQVNIDNQNKITVNNNISNEIKVEDITIPQNEDIDINSREQQNEQSDKNTQAQVAKNEENSTDSINTNSQQESATENLKKIRISKTQEQEEENAKKLKIALNYTQCSFASYLSDDNFDLLWQNILLYMDNSDYTDYMPVEFKNLLLDEISTLDLEHFGWNIWSYNKRINQMKIASFLKTVFPKKFSDKNVLSIKKHLTDFPNKGKIKIQEDLF